jgi:hypothetical protein
MKRTYIYCSPCEKVVEKWVGCEHQNPARPGRSAAPLTVFFEGPNGEVQIPGRVGRMPERLRKLGYQEKVIQDSKQYSDFCKRMDKEAYRKHEEHQERLQAQFDKQQRARREDLMSQLTTQFGRDFAREAMNESERQSREQQRYFAGSHLEGFEYDGKHGRD